MKRWKDASPSERDVLTQRALREAGTVKGAAALLDVSRRQLTRFRARRRARDGETPETRSPTETRSLTSLSETRIFKPPLTAAADASRFPSTTLVEMTVEIPEELLQWLEQRALRRKHAGVAARVAKSPIVVEALAEYRQRVELVERQLDKGK